MDFITTPIAGLYIIQPKIFADDRGYFFESYNETVFKNIGLNLDFKQDNQSLSQKNVLRGLHFQSPPYAQGKLVRVISGSVLDVAVDIRKSSKTYGQYCKIVLNEENKTMFYIPEGFAHGFLTLENNTIFSYKCTNLYNKESEQTINWDDKKIGVDWNMSNPIISEKDKIGLPFKDFSSPFA